MVSPTAIREAREREQAGWRQVAAREQKPWQKTAKTVLGPRNERRAYNVPLPDNPAYLPVMRMEDVRRAFFYGDWNAPSNAAPTEPPRALTVAMVREAAEQIRRDMARPNGFVEYFGGSAAGSMRPIDQPQYANRCDCLICRGFFPPDRAAIAARRAAESRALALFKSWLSPQQLSQFEENNHIDVTGCDTGRRYRITKGRQLNVMELRDGKPAKGLCFVPAGNLAVGDVMLAQKVALETRESEALAVAQPFHPNSLLPLIWAEI